jgi:hypothetical protein
MAIRTIATAWLDQYDEIRVHVKLCDAESPLFSMGGTSFCRFGATAESSCEEFGLPP